MKFLSLIAFLSLNAFAQNYTLQQFENSNYRDYTREELMTRLGASSSLLPNYTCNGKNEFELFWPALRENSNGDSLQIQVYKTDEKIIYKKGQYYKQNGEIQTDFSNIFVAYVVPALKRLEAFPEGQMLLRNLERSYFPLTITFGNNAFNPKDAAGHSGFGIFQANALSIFSYGRMTSENVPFDDIGAGGAINWNPKDTSVLPHVALAHEMYHAFDSIRGILDMRFVKGDEYEFAMLSEYRAVYFENLARKVAGIPYRTHYGQDQTGPGVLDANGNPRKMPSPCLNH